jgi:hypothetical protein
LAEMEIHKNHSLTVLSQPAGSWCLIF